LNLNISASKQNIKKKISNFGAIRVRIMHANFQASSFTGVGGEWTDRRFHTECQVILNRSLYKISKLFPCFARDGFTFTIGKGGQFGSLPFKIAINQATNRATSFSQFFKKYWLYYPNLTWPILNGQVKLE